MADNRKGAARVSDVQARLMKAFEQKVGQIVYVDDLAAEFGTHRDTVQKGVLNLKQREEWRERVEIVVRGQAWRYLGPDRKGAGSKLCFEQIGVTREGDLILQCEDDRIFRAKEL